MTTKMLNVFVHKAVLLNLNFLIFLELLNNIFQFVDLGQNKIYEFVPKLIQIIFFLYLISIFRLHYFKYGR